MNKAFTAIAGTVGLAVFSCVFCNPSAVLLAETFPAPPEEDWRPFDTDRDGRLSEPEFKAFESAKREPRNTPAPPASEANPPLPAITEEPARNERMTKILRKFDSDGDQRWSPAELRIFKDYKTLNGFEFLYDMDQNGKLDSKEKRLRDKEIEGCERLFSQKK